MDTAIQDDLGFTFRSRKSGEVHIFRQGAVIVMLRGDAAATFLAEVSGCDARDAQQLMARVTGNYKRGNERLASRHSRNAR